MYTDETLNCTDCNAPFTFSAGEQEFFAAKGFTNKPNRCPDCRAARKSQRGGGGGGGGSSYSGGGGGGYGGSRPAREMFQATCSGMRQGCRGSVPAPRRQAGLLPRLLLAAPVVPLDASTTRRTSDDERPGDPSPGFFLAVLAVERSAAATRSRSFQSASGVASRSRLPSSSRKRAAAGTAPRRTVAA